MMLPRLLSLLMDGNFEAAKRRASNYPEEIRLKKRISALFYAIMMVPQVPLDVVEVMLREDTAYSKQKDLVPSLLCSSKFVGSMICETERVAMLMLLIRHQAGGDIVPVDQLLCLLKLVSRYVPECWTEPAGRADNFLVELVVWAAGTTTLYEHLHAACQYLVESHPSLLTGRLKGEDSTVTLTVVDFVLFAAKFIPHRHQLLDLFLPPIPRGNLLHRMIGWDTQSSVSITLFVDRLQSTKRVESLEGQDNDGQTPLLRALLSRDVHKILAVGRCVSLYDLARESMTVTNGRGDTALDVAILLKTPLIIRYIFALFPPAFERLMMPVGVYPFLLCARHVDDGHSNQNDIYEILKTRPDLVMHASKRKTRPEMALIARKRNKTCER